MQLKRDKGHRVYRSRSQLIVGIFAMVMFDLFAVATIAHNPHRLETIYLQSSIIILSTIIFGRLAWAAVTIKDERLQVANIFSSFNLQWDQIERFELGRSGILPSVCRIRLKDGRTRSALGISESNYSAMRGRGAAGQMVEELNHELVVRNEPSSSRVADG
jgi:hypothetical protein